MELPGLPTFIKRLTAFADKVEAHFSAKDELKTATERIAALETELAAVKAASPDGAVEITQLKNDLGTAKTALEVKEKELTDFKAKAETDLAAAQNKANEVLASMGISLEQLPAAGDPNGKGDKVAALRAQLVKSNDPSEKFALAMQIRELTNPTPKAKA